jgi:uncharacterized protein YfaS (alpha-2-macroglobulin family)
VIAWLRGARIALALVSSLAFCASAASAARPLLDQHQWDAYFALFARDVNVPWKPTSVRLDTYSGAPVDFAAYNVDPAQVIIAGQNRTPRALDTSKLKPLLRWHFSPPPGYRFESNDVPVPLGTQEGFYVIEARRGDAVQQVWLNRTHIGLLTKESPDGLVLWGVDLRSGRAIPHMSVQFLVGLNLITQKTDRDGIIVWRDRSRPSFALAADGAGRAFVSIFPQAPTPQSVVAVRLDSAVVRAGQRVRFVGFARHDFDGIYRKATGDARVTVAGHGTTLASTLVRLDAAGAFSGDIGIPAAVDAGDYAVLASVGGAVGGTSVHVDAASDIALAIHPTCPCDPDRDVPFSVVARRGTLPGAGVAVRVQIVRTPHLVAPGAPDDAARWGTTAVYDRTLRTDAEGRAGVTIPSASDGLDSTYGIRVTARGASATARIVVPSAKVALALEPDAASADVGEPIAFEVRGFDSADGTATPGLSVKVKLSHGPASQEQNVTLDARGTAHVVFKQTYLGANLAIAQASFDGRTALDATAVTVEPSALSGRTISAEGAVSVSLDRARYRPGDTVAVRAQTPGASGDALVTLEGAKTYAMRKTGVSDGSTSTSLPLRDPQGALRVGTAVVRDGAIAMGFAPVNVDAPGHPRLTDLALDKSSYEPGETAHVTVRDGDTKGGATVAYRIADGRESGPALFEDAPGVLASAATSSQAPASDDPEWHAYVAPARSKASDIFAAERPRKVGSEEPSIGAAAPRTLLWRIVRDDTPNLDVPVPAERGHYVLSVLKISDDGDVGAASVAFNVQ